MDPLHEAVHDARASYKLVLEQGGGDIEVCGSLCVRACVYVCVCACKCAWLFHPTSATRTPSKQASMTKLPQDQRLLPAASIEISRSIFHLVNLSLLLCCFLCPCPVQDESPVRPATRYRQERSTHFSNLFLAFIAPHRRCTPLCTPSLKGLWWICSYYFALCYLIPNEHTPL